MKLYATSYKDKKQIREIDGLVGKSFSLIERIKMGGIGSKRLEVDSVSDDFKIALNATHYQTLVSLELRPKGVLIYFRRRLDNFTVVCSFSDLQIHSAKTICFTNGSSSICFKGGYEIDYRFFDQLFDGLKTYDRSN